MQRPSPEEMNNREGLQLMINGVSKYDEFCHLWYQRYLWLMLLDSSSLYLRLGYFRVCLETHAFEALSRK